MVTDGATLATQNGAAAREVLAGPHCEQIASDLMKQPVTNYYPFFGDDGSGRLQGFFPEANPEPYFDGQLMDVTARYLFDLANSADNPGGSTITTLFNSARPGTPYTILLAGVRSGSDSTAESTFLKQIVSDPGDAGVLEAASATKIPVLGSVLGGTETAAGLLGINPQFSTDNAASTAQTNAQEFAVSETQLNVTLVQALINEGAIPASSLQGQEWYHNGRIVLSNSTTTSQFTSWYDGVAGQYGLASKQREYSWYMNHQQALSSDSP